MGRDVCGTIMALNFRWSREQVADWVETVEHAHEARLDEAEALA